MSNTFGIFYQKISINKRIESRSIKTFKYLNKKRFHLHKERFDLYFNIYQSI